MTWQNERPAGDKAERRARLLGFFLAAITVAAYLPVWHAGFIWDDKGLILTNPLVHAADGWYRAWFTRSAGDFVPATLLSFWLEWRLWGVNPLGYHVDNVLLHACNVILLWRVLLHLKIPGAWLAAALFAVHPVTVASVAWIAERKNTLAMLLLLVSVQFYLTFEDTAQRRWYWLAAGMFLLALMGKTAVVPLPAVLLGLAWWRRGRVNGNDFQRTLLFIALALAASILALWIQRGASVGVEVRADSFWSRLAGAGWAVWFYFYKTIVPVHLIFIYPRWEIDSRQVLSYLPLALLASVFVVCWRCRHPWAKAILFALGYFVVMLLPILGFFNISYMRHSLVADQWAYFAVLGPIALVAAVIRSRMVGIALLLALGALTWNQCALYTNDETIWADTVRRNSRCWLAQVNLAMLLDDRGKSDEAIPHLLNAIQQRPHDEQARYDLGLIYLHQGRLADAIAQFRAATAINPQYDIGFANLGVALAQQGHLSEAIDSYKKALAIAPNNPYAHNALGRALETGGKLADAAEQYSAAIDVKPDLVEARENLGNLHIRLKKFQNAAADYSEAVRFQPNYLPANFNLALTLSRLGQTNEAVPYYRKALELATAAGDKDLAGQIQEHLHTSAAHEPAGK